MKLCKIGTGQYLDGRPPETIRPEEVLVKPTEGAHHVGFMSFGDGEAFLPKKLILEVRC